MDKQVLYYSSIGNLERVKQCSQKCRRKTKIFQAFAQACANGHFEIVKYLKDKFDIMDVDNGLRRAAHNNHLSIVKYLVQNEGTISMKKNIIFSSACRSGNLEFVEYLISLEIKDIDVDNLIHTAIIGNHIHIVECFMRNGLFPINCHHSFNLACKTKNLNVIKLIHSHKINISLHSSIAGYVCIHDAVEIAKYIIENKVTYHSIERWLNTAISRNSINVLALLEQYQCDYSMYDKYTLSIAIDDGYIEILRFFVEKQLVKLRMKHFTVKILQSKSTSLQYLLEQNIQIINEDEQTNFQNEFILKKLCEFGNLKCVQCIVEKGANIFIDDCTPLINACLSGNVYLVKYLVSKGANVFTLNNTCLKIARDYCYISIFCFLSQFYDHIDSSKICWYSNVERFHLILCTFYYSPQWMVQTENMKDNELWDSNIGLIVASFVW